MQNRTKLAHVAKLSAAFNSGSLTEEQQRLRGEAFLEGLSDYSPDEVETACRWWLQGKNGDGHENYAFAPAVPQLARLCHKVRYQFRVPPSPYPTIVFHGDEPSTVGGKKPDAGFRRLGEAVGE